MIVVFVMAIICNIIMYMIFINSVAPFLFSIEAFSLIPVVIMTIVAILGYYLDDLAPFGKNSRFLPLLLLPLCFLPFQGIVPALFMVLPCGYLILNITIKNFSVDFPKTRKHILFCMKFAFLPLLVAFFGGYEYLVTTNYFPFLFLFLAFGICLLRMLLNDESTISNSRFILSNLGLIGGILTLLLVFGSPPVMRFFFNIGGFILRNILIPILTAVLRFLALLSSLFSVYEDREITFLYHLIEEEREPRLYAMPRTAYDSLFVNIPGVLLGILIVFVVIFVILVIRNIFIEQRKKYLNLTTQTSNFKRQRMSGTDISKDEVQRKEKRFFKPRDYRLAIRYNYSRFLRMCKEKGSPPIIGNTTTEIHQANREFFNEPTMTRLRELYLKARYSDVEITKDESIESGELLKRLSGG
jgi:hypothetical protein